MNITNKDYFTFNVDNSLLLVGQTGTGKTELVKTLINRTMSSQSAAEVRFVIFDLKVVEFNHFPKDYLLFDVITDPNEGLDKLDKLAQLSKERTDNAVTIPMIFIYISKSVTWLLLIRVDLIKQSLLLISTLKLPI
jgi:septin family protein